MPKAEKKKQQKIIEDKTFGLKNKNKSKAVQKFIKGVQNTVKNSGKSAAALQAEQFEKKKMKKKQAQEEALLNALYKDVGKLNIDTSSDEEDDPKNTVCPYFKQGLCQKGKKCIYSHDLTLDRTQEIDLYVDQRVQLIMNQIGSKNLNDFSQEELGKLISDKEKQYIKGAKSEIVCKHFMEAVQKDKYGWNWTCINGDGCKYKHCLPPGYILQKDAGKIKIQAKQVNIEEKIDEERNNYLNKQKKGQLVTFEIFMKWKQDRAKRKAKEAQKKKKEQEKKNKNKALLRNGRQLFTLDPTLFIDDAEAADNYDDRQEQQQDEEVKREENHQDANEEEEGMQKIEQKQEQNDD